MKKLTKILSIVLAVIVALSSLCIFASAEPKAIYDISYNYKTHTLSWSCADDVKVDNYEVRAGDYYIELYKTSLNISKLLDKAKETPDAVKDNSIEIEIVAFGSDGKAITNTYYDLDLNEPARDTDFFALLGDLFVKIGTFFSDLFAPKPTKS